MRACFLGQNICTLGFGVAILQTAPMVAEEDAGGPVPAPDENRAGAKDAPPPPVGETHPTAH